MDANRHLDEKSAKLLLERGLATNANGRLEFTRDINVKKAVSVHFLFESFSVSGLISPLFPTVLADLSGPFRRVHSVQTGNSQKFEMSNSVLGRLAALLWRNVL